MDLVAMIAALDAEPSLHAARLLVLISAFSGTGQGDAVEGLTKLAKLDFLLRYPVMLERALAAKGRSTRDVQLEDHERLSVESQMVRYRFGPWDHRYREFLQHPCRPGARHGEHGGTQGRDFPHRAWAGTGVRAEREPGISRLREAIFPVEATF